MENSEIKYTCIVCGGSTEIYDLHDDNCFDCANCDGKGYKLKSELESYELLGALDEIESELADAKADLKEERLQHGLCKISLDHEKRLENRAKKRLLGIRRQS